MIQITTINQKKQVSKYMLEAPRWLWGEVRAIAFKRAVTINQLIIDLLKKLVEDERNKGGK